MQQKQSPYVYWLSVTMYLFLSFLSYYCACYKLPVGLKYGVSLVVGAWAFLVFIFKADFAKMKFVFVFGVIFMLPFAIFWLWSVGIWIEELKSIGFIIRGSKNIIYMLTNIIYFCGAFYLFGQRSVYYTFYSMCAANFICFLMVGKEYGFGELISEYFRLILTFAADTGPAVRRLELHDIVFGFGVYAIYFALHRRNGKFELGHFLLAMFFFTLGFKRIGVAAAGVGVVAGYIYKAVSEKKKKLLLKVFPFATMGLLLLYVWSIQTGVYFSIMESFGINLMGRKTMYNNYKSFYSISPTYLGRGIRFIFNYGETTGTTKNLHSVALELYIELGFWLWLFWLWYDLRFRAVWIGKRYGYDASVFLVAVMVFAFITYLTDNTYFYFPICVAYRHLSLAWVDETVKNKSLTEKKNEEINTDTSLFRRFKQKWTF